LFALLRAAITFLITERLQKNNVGNAAEFLGSIFYVANLFSML